MPAPFVLVSPRLMAGATDTTAAPVTPELPVLNITVKVDSLIRLPGDPVVATVVVNRTVNSDVSCSVPWSILGTGTNPVTSAYFIGSVFPSGTISFGIGETSKTVTFSLSAGSRPSFEMTGRFRLGVPTGAKLGATSFFDFYLLSPLTFPTRVDAAEPGWVNIPTYATSPGKVLFSTVADMTTAVSSATAGSTMVLTTNLDAGGATFTLDAEGTTADPIFLRGNSDKKASFPELSNATIICTGQRWVICNLRLKNVRILVRSSSYTEIKQNRFYFYSDGGATKGAIVFESTSTSRYTHIYGNDFIGSTDAPFKRSAIFGGALTGGVFYKYVWVRKNLFKGFTDDPTVANSAIMIGPNDHDSLTDAHFYVAENLFLDYIGVGYVVDTGSAGVACFDNTFEAKTSTSKQWLRIRQGCTKPTQATGNIIDGNMWTAPVGSTTDLGGISIADGFTVVVNNWACLLASAASPIATSPSATAKIALARGSLDWTGWPDNYADAPAGRAWPNCAYAYVGGNHIPIVVGDATTRPWLTSDTLVKTANLFVAPNDTARADRNSSITYGPSHSLSDVVNSAVISQASFTRIPTRRTEANTGWGLLSGLSYPIPAINYSLDTFSNTAKAQNLTAAYEGPTPLTLTIVSAPAHGTTSISGGTLTFTPSTGYVGSDTLTYRLTDAEGTYVEGVITYTVAGLTLTVAAPADVSEGNSGTKTIRFVVTKSGGTGSCSATWTLTGGVNAADFQSGQAFSGTVTFASGDTTKNIDFTLKGDTDPEDNEQMTVTLSAPSSCALGTPYFGTTSILNDDTAALGGRLYNPPHGPASTSDVVTWLITDPYPGDGNWTKYLLIVLPPSATQLRIQKQTLKYKGVFIIGGKMNLVGNQNCTFQGKTEALPGDPGNVFHLNFTTTDMPSGLIGNYNGDPGDGRPFIWIDGVDMDSCWAVDDVMGTKQSCWWGDFFSFGTKTPSDSGKNKWVDVYLLRHRIKNGFYFGNLQEITGSLGHSDIMQNNNAQIRSLNVWKCDHKHFGQGFFAGSGAYTLPNDGWWEISDCVFRRPPKSSKVYSSSQTPTWNPIQAVDNSCNPDVIVHTTTQYEGPTIDVQPGEYYAVLLGPRNYFEFPSAVDNSINCLGIGLMGYSIYGTTQKVSRNYSTRVMTVGVSDMCVTHDPPFHKYPYVGKTGAGGPFNRAAGFYTRSCGMSVPSTAPLTEAEVGLSRRITTAADLLTYISSGT